jgi:hypothetical protein
MSSSTGREAGLTVAIGEANPIGGFRRGHDDLADAELHRRLDDVVGADGVDTEGFVVGTNEDSRHGGKMHHGIEFWNAGAWFQLIEIGVARHHVEHLT